MLSYREILVQIGVWLIKSLITDINVNIFDIDYEVVECFFPVEEGSSRT